MTGQIQWLPLADAAAALDLKTTTLSKRAERNAWERKWDDGARRWLYAVSAEVANEAVLDDDEVNACAALQTSMGTPSGLMHDPVTGRYLIRNGSRGAIVNQLPGRVEQIARAIHRPEAFVDALANAGIGGSQYKVPRIRIRSAYPSAPPTMLHISTRDLHIGEGGGDDDYEAAIVDRVSATLQWATHAHGTLEQIVVTFGSDMLTVDNAQRQTTKGTQIPGAASPWAAMGRAQRLMITVIDLCRQVAPVVGLQEQGNHDAVTGAAVALMCQAWYRECDDVTIIVPECGGVWTAHEWHDIVLFGHHGHKRNPTRVAETVAGMYPRQWGRARYRYVMMGHRHHTQRYPLGHAGGVEILQTSSPSPGTEYEHDQGYVDDARILESFVFQRGHGLVTHRRARVDPS